MNTFDVAIVGGGFAGSAVAVQLARQAGRSLRIVMYDRAGAFGRGTAYGPTADSCLLNVRAKAMGAFPDAEGDFLRWLRESGYGVDDPDLGERFVPRRFYGAYLCSLVDAHASALKVLERRATCVDDIVPGDEGYRLITPGGAAVWAAAVVLALGNLPPRGFGDGALVAALRTHARNPWDVLEGPPLDRDAGVFIIGTGLTALDVLVHLTASGHRGRITMLSRHARFPLAHTATTPRAASALPLVSGRPRDVMRAVRRLVREAASDGRSWHEVIDALRPQVNRIWQHWTIDDRRQFSRHIASLWEVHRHRAPDVTLAVRDALASTGQLRILRGDLTSVERAGEKLAVAYLDRGLAAPGRAQADVLVDCSGTRYDMSNCADPLVAALVARKLVAPGPLGIGFAAAPDGKLAGEGARAAIYALGSPLRGTLAESSAVREVREQARVVAAAITAHFGMRTTPATVAGTA